MDELGPAGRRAFMRGMAESIRETLLRCEIPERVELTTIVLDLVVPKDEAELQLYHAFLDLRDKLADDEPELPL